MVGVGDWRMCKSGLACPQTSTTGLRGARWKNQAAWEETFGLQGLILKSCSKSAQLENLT